MTAREEVKSEIGLVRRFITVPGADLVPAAGVRRTFALIEAHFG